jgi:steroid 5-alpha reductase family enzyme
MAFLGAYAIAAAVVLGLMIVLWVISLILEDAGIVGIFFGAGFLVVNWLYSPLAPDGFPVRKWRSGGPTISSHSPRVAIERFSVLPSRPSS